MANVCQIRVTSDGKYCCDVKHLTVRPDCIGQIKFSNLPATVIEYEVTEDNWIPAAPASIAGDGCETLLKPGEYRFLIDCADYNGTEAPAEGSVGLCYECCKVDDWGSIMSAQLDELCDKIVASDDAAANAEIIAQLQAICTKLLASNVLTEETNTELMALCQKMLDQMDQAQANADAQLACFEEMKDLMTCPPATPLGVLTTWN